MVGFPISLYPNILGLPTADVVRHEAQVLVSDRVTIPNGLIQHPAGVEEKFQEHQIDVAELFITCNLFASIIRSGCVKHFSGSGELIPGPVLHEQIPRINTVL
ncbi:MAG: hypothetical protein L6R35_000269 [Caloplaca aegaea]|nr:MAG: hypothetical protein L6R35_000269 [Caloplaca aegaea]